MGIWFNGSTWSNNNTNNLPFSKQTTWDDWWADNQKDVKAAGKEFWERVQA